MTIIERALELVPDGSLVGLGSGRAARAFVTALGGRVRAGRLHVHGVPTSEETAALARQEGVPLLTLAEAEILDATVDGADEVAPNLDLIKGYGRAFVREKIVAASSRRLIILVGDEKLVPRLGAAGCRSRSFPSPFRCARGGWPTSAAGRSPIATGTASS